MEKILRFDSRIVIPANPKPFIVRENFVLKRDGGICYKISDTFWMAFGDTVEEPSDEHIICEHCLLEKACNKFIIEAIGVEDNIETSLYGLFYLMNLQRNREDGVLMVDGYKNIVYARGYEKKLYAACASWQAGAWNISGQLITRVQSGFYRGDQVFSRYSKIESTENLPLMAS